MDQEQIDKLMTELARLDQTIQALDRLTDAKFVTFRVLLDGQADKVALALAASDKAVNKAEAATEKRFESVNEFRGQLADQVARFATRENIDLISVNLRERSEALAERTRAQLDEVKSQSGRIMLGLMSTIVGTLVTALVLVLTR